MNTISTTRVGASASCDALLLWSHTGTQPQARTPRIPSRPISTPSRPGKRLKELHIDYEKKNRIPLKTMKAEVTFRVERMKLSKDKSTLRYNDFLTLRNIPPAAFD